MKRRIRFHRSDFLFSTPKLIIGVGSVFNVAGNYYSFNESESSKEADLKALRNDWGVVGSDLENAMKSFSL